MRPRELCPKQNDTKNSLSKKSHVEEFDGVPELFNVLTSSQGDEYEWNIFTFQMDFDSVFSGPKLEKDLKYFLKTSSNGITETLRDHENTITVNCTVIYLDQCTSWNKCRQSCQSTGASSYRWFHDGCCECVGSTCINYGVNESRCRSCPEFKEENSDDYNDEDLKDFGDGIGPLDGTANKNF